MLILNIFRKIFGVIVVKNYIILPDKTCKKVNIKNIPNTFYFRETNEYFNVIKITSEIINEVLVYNWINVEPFNISNNEKKL